MAGQQKAVDLSEGDKCATFELNLEKGLHYLRTRFFLENGKSIGAYYVYAQKVE